MRTMPSVYPIWRERERERERPVVAYVVFSDVAVTASLSLLWLLSLLLLLSLPARLICPIERACNALLYQRVQVLRALRSERDMRDGASFLPLPPLFPHEPD